MSTAQTPDSTHTRLSRTLGGQDRCPISQAGNRLRDLARSMRCQARGRVLFRCWVFPTQDSASKILESHPQAREAAVTVSFSQSRWKPPCPGGPVCTQEGPAHGVDATWAQGILCPHPCQQRPDRRVKDSEPEVLPHPPPDL